MYLFPMMMMNILSFRRNLPVSAFLQIEQDFRVLASSPGLFVKLRTGMISRDVSFNNVVWCGLGSTGQLAISLFYNMRLCKVSIRALRYRPNVWQGTSGLSTDFHKLAMRLSNVPEKLVVISSLIPVVLFDDNISMRYRWFDLVVNWDRCWPS